VAATKKRISVAITDTPRPDKNRATPLKRGEEDNKDKNEVNDWSFFFFSFLPSPLVKGGIEGGLNMCGRYTLATDLEGFLSELDLAAPAELLHPRRYNVAPGQPVLGIVADPEPRLEVMEWGYIPSWAKPESHPKPVINARVETVEEKPYFRGAFRSSRCGLLADGFYEWKRVGKEKQPVRITMKDGSIFAMAGLWSNYYDVDGSHRATCAIITVEPNELMEPIHNRMPAILSVPDLLVWLDPRAQPRDLHAVLGPYPADELRAYEVGTVVNAATNDVPQCIEPIL
jgi:putative SOS response-associated peptidase YedK